MYVSNCISNCFIPLTSIRYVKRVSQLNIGVVPNQVSILDWSLRFLPSPSPPSSYFKGIFSVTRISKFNTYYQPEFLPISSLCCDAMVYRAIQNCPLWMTTKLFICISLALLTRPSNITRVYGAAWRLSTAKAVAELPAGA